MHLDTEEASSRKPDLSVRTCEEVMGTSFQPVTFNDLITSRLLNDAFHPDHRLIK